MVFKKLPCKNCITLAICKSEFKKTLSDCFFKINNYEVVTSESVYFYLRNELVLLYCKDKNCYMLDEYIFKYFNKDYKYKREIEYCLYRSRVIKLYNFMNDIKLFKRIIRGVTKYL